MTWAEAWGTRRLHPAESHLPSNEPSNDQQQAAANLSPTSSRPCQASTAEEHHHRDASDTTTTSVESAHNTSSSTVEPKPLTKPEVHLPPGISRANSLPRRASTGRPPRISRVNSLPRLSQNPTLRRQSVPVTATYYRMMSAHGAGPIIHGVKPESSGASTLPCIKQSPVHHVRSAARARVNPSPAIRGVGPCHSAGQHQTTATVNPSPQDKTTKNNSPRHAQISNKKPESPNTVFYIREPDGVLRKVIYTDNSDNKSFVNESQS